MSALPPKADIRWLCLYVRFVPKADSCNAANRALFDHLVGSGEQRLRHVEAERLGGREIDASSNLVGCSTGRSAGLAPLRILST